MAIRSLAPDSLLGQKLGHYRIMEKVGAGGMGEVYRAHDEHLDREVAIKVLPPGMLSDEPSRKRFRKEALALSKLNHPNIATIHDFDTQQGVDFLVMEYIPGITLSEKLAVRPLPEKEVLALGTQLAEGLAAAHEHGVVHRDLKPGNLRLTGDGRLKILDFGLAKLRLPVTATAVTESMSETQAMAGTLPYMAPEQLLGGEVDARTDIHAAGSVLYEMATGKRPFAEVEQSQLIGAILQRPPQPLRALNTKRSPELERIIGKCLEKEPENRYQSAIELAVDLRRVAASASTRQPLPARQARKSWAWKAAAALVLAAFLVVTGLLFRSRRAHALTASDTIVLADFVNSTGDPVFDEALKQALTVQLEQSPFLNVLPQTKIRDTLRLMARSSDEHLTPELGRELCQRAGGKALIAGSIAPLGSQYVIGLTAAECGNGNHLASVQLQAANKEAVLKVLGNEVSNLRSKLGESLGSVQKFDVPIEEATTSSLEALKTYSLGRKVLEPQGDLAAIPFYERALELDPNFVEAYTALGAAQWNLERSLSAAATLEKAFVLRDRVSERERFHISGLYHKMVTGDVERANQIYRQWAQTYPSDYVPHYLLGVNLMDFGFWEEAAAQERDSLRLSPDDSWACGNLAVALLALNQPDSADATMQEALLHIPDHASLQLPLYLVAFHRGDRTEMERLLAYSKGKPDEQELLSAHSDTETYYGQLEKARYFSRRAAESELQAGSHEKAALRQANAALHEAELGYPALVRADVVAALAPAPGWRVRVLAGLALARIGESTRARAIVRDLERSNPSDTRLNVYWLPTIKAAIEIAEGNPVRAVSVLEQVTPYELGGMNPLQVGPLYPVYLRGQAYLLQHDGSAAAAEFQKFLDHRGIVLNYPLGALAYLQLGRAYAMSGNTEKAKAAYHDFLTLWKDADTDVPILKQAKAEYAKLK